MAVTINGSTGITGVNGSAATPAMTGTDTDTGIVYGTNTLSLVTGGTTGVTLDSSQNLQMNSGFGSVATVYGCRAWVNFNGTGTVAIRASGGVTSITDNGTGNYTVNFTGVMPDSNYAVTQGGGEVQTATLYSGSTAARVMQVGSVGSTGVQIFTGYQYSSSALQDWAYVHVGIFR